VRVNPHWSGIFIFLYPFDDMLWVAIIFTAVFVGVAVLLTEVPLRRMLRAPRPTLDKCRNLEFASMGMLVQVSALNVRSTGGRVIVLGYGFIVLILINA
jgi:hypothetical protein